MCQTQMPHQVGVGSPWLTPNLSPETESSGHMGLQTASQGMSCKNTPSLLLSPDLQPPLVHEPQVEMLV